MGVSKNNGTPKSSIFNRVFHYIPSILGYPYFWETPKSTDTWQCTTPKIFGAKNHWEDSCLIGNTSSKGPFSNAMLDYWSVSTWCLLCLLCSIRSKSNCWAVAHPHPLRVHPTTPRPVLQWAPVPRANSIYSNQGFPWYNWVYYGICIAS